MVTRLLFASALCLAVVGSAMASSFTAGNLVVSRIGDGVNSYSTGVAAPAYLDEYTTAGTAVGNSVALPTTASGSNYTLTMSQTATSMGFLTRSTDGKYLTVFGYDAPVNTTGPSSNSSYQGRTVGRVDWNGAVDTTTRFLAAGSTPRSAVSTNGTDLWIGSDTGSGTTGGVRYLTLGTTNAANTTLLFTTPTTNTRVVNIANGQLYFTTGAATPRGVYQVGTGLPTTSGQTCTSVVGPAGTVDSGYDFWFADANTLYVADDDTTAPLTQGLQKWVYSAGSWSKAWTAVPSGSTGLRSVAGVVDGSGNVTIYGITAKSGTTTANELVSLSDTLGGILAPGFTTLATAGANTVFRGVDFAPVPEPATLALLAGAGLMMLRRRTR